MRRFDLLVCIGGVIWGPALVSSLDNQHNGLDVNNLLDCYRDQECKDLHQQHCKPGYTYVGWTKDNCDGGSFGKRICCNSDTVERFGVDAQGNKKKCIWRGAGRNCNGAGSEGEVVLFKSGNGGGPTESDQSQCSTGYKYFTCPLPEWDGLTSGCRWTGWYVMVLMLTADI
ncbi:uncharacterized protein LY79DRAFT_520478 [Colletotrichum navitas]|uniref:Secreted protein n=1 Tax=Colletotrichum navitas TaxID=681940 RepID=A0AAD8PV93_9PEZI|nr:uncharacterized protein LY79DRAFT_520478 [Colletotrichum navitas]KAK1580588.1 hypothetical protein LY79DRAFT_520478 [Colletotrichum navitas]